MYNFYMPFVSKKILFALILIAVLPLLTQAQLLLPNLGSPVSFILSPENPGPDEIVDVRIESFSLDLNRTTINWLVDGSLFAQGNGLDAIQIRTGPIGSETIVSVIIRPDEVTEIFDQIVIRPTHISILWEADTYTPPFYQGRALPSSNSTILIEAYPDIRNQLGNKIPNNDLIFTWKKNGGIINRISGRGQSSAIIDSPLLFGEDIISVDVVSLDNRYNGSSFARIPSKDPHISIYKDDPLIGIMYHQAIPSFDTIPQSDITLAAVPFYFSARNSNDTNVSYVWEVNNLSIPTDPRDPSRIILRLANGIIGAATVSLDISHVEHFLQSASNAWTLSISNESAQGNDPFFRRTN